MDYVKIPVYAKRVDGGLEECGAIMLARSSCKEGTEVVILGSVQGVILDQDMDKLIEVYENGFYE